MTYLRRSLDADEADGFPTPRVSLDDDDDASSTARQFAVDVRDGHAFSAAGEVEEEENDTTEIVQDGEPADDSALPQPPPFESEVVEEDHLDAAEDHDVDESRSFQNNATLQVGTITKTTYQSEVEKIEIEVTEVTVEAEQDENTNESSDNSSAPPSATSSPAKRAPLTRDRTQNLVNRDGARNDEGSDWARRNQGRNKVLGLIAKFSDPISVSNASLGYKTEHGIAKVGQIKQSKFQ